MSETDYSIDEVKLMAKVKRYKRRWKEQRHYSEYLKCKLAKKALQVQELKKQVKTLQAIKSGNPRMPRFDHTATDMIRL